MESQFERLLKEKLSLMEDMRLQSMVDPGFASFEEYRYNLGYIAAIRQVLAAIEETQSDMRKD